MSTEIVWPQAAGEEAPKGETPRKGGGTPPLRVSSAFGVEAGGPRLSDHPSVFVIRPAIRRLFPRRTMTGLLNLLTPWAIPLLLLLAWQVLARAGLISKQILPAPTDVLRAGITLAHTELWADVAVSARRALTGFVLGGSVGFLLGMLNGLTRPGERLLDSSVQMFRTIPHLAMIPLVILWFGIGENAKVFLVALGVFFPIYLNTFHGMQAVDPGLLETARVYGLRGGRLFREVILPAALPSILIGVRFALGAMWLTLIVAETVAADSGIGYITMNAREFMQTDVVVFGILLYALLGKAADLVARGLERRLLPWHPNYQRAKG